MAEEGLMAEEGACLSESCSKGIALIVAAYFVPILSPGKPDRVDNQ
jgi:hypothetical protein